MAFDLPHMKTELLHARATLAGLRLHFADHLFSGNGQAICPHTLNRDLARGLSLVVLLGVLIGLALMRDILSYE